ncbi:MAG: putative bifunctional diguanylate cyclase/phosphodiesterase [Gemmatimonadota bacterium]
MEPFLRHRPAARIALILGGLGVLWILLSDWMVHALLPQRVWPEAQMVKGTLFVLGGAAIAYGLVRAFHKRVEGVVERLERAESIGGIGGWELDLESGELTWTRQVHRILGTSPGGFDPSRERFFGFVHPDDRPELEAAQRAAVEGEGALDVEHRIVRADGEMRWVHERAELVEDDDGRRLSGTVEDVTEQRRLEQALRHRALHDTLTDLPNRTLFRDRLEGAFARAERSGESLALLMLDLVRFKDINDSLGHRTGDGVLQEVAHRLRGGVRESDTVARVGGDEFAVLLDGVDGMEMAEGALGRIDAALGEPMEAGGESLEVDVVAGVAFHAPGGGPDEAAHPQDLVRSADLAMHRAKEKGAHHVYSPEEDGKLGGRLRRVQRLREAVEAGEIVPFYQPVVRLDTLDVWGVEPLARWRHPERGLVGPGEFIPLAEESGLIGRLGEVVLRQACRRVARWNREGLTERPLRVSANLSARQLEDDDLAGEVDDILGEAGLRPRLCQFEVTETAILRARAGLDALRRRGVGIAIDDFGTGYASFTYLRDLEIDALKIDMSFVQGVAEDDGDRAICRTVVGLAEAFGLGVIAEGIETEAQRDELLAFGCEVGQGFLFARPRPAEETRRFLTDGPREARA